MKKVTMYGSGHFMRYCCPRASRLMTAALFFLLCMAQLTDATAQVQNEKAGIAPHAKGFTVAENVTPGKSRITPTSLAFNKMENGLPNETEQANTGEGRLMLYPDQVSDYLLVMLPTAAMTGKLVTVSSMDGETLATDTIVAGATNTVIDMKKIPFGTYAVTIDDAADKQVLRLVKN